MRYQRVYVEAFEVFVPPVELTTAALERALSPLYRRIGIPERVLESLTGVNARRFWAEGTTPSGAAVEVGAT